METYLAVVTYKGIRDLAEALQQGKGTL